MSAAVARVTESDGAVGALINNAGHGQSGAVESVPLDDVRRQFETNVFGLIRMCQLVLPAMRERGEGTVVNVGSMGGRLTFPGAGIYHSKNAVEVISDALRFEVRGFGVNVVLIEPGLITTNFGEAAAGSGERNRCRPDRALRRVQPPRGGDDRRRLQGADGQARRPTRDGGGRDRQGPCGQATQATLRGDAERAPAHRPAPVRARPPLGPHDAHPVPNAPALAPAPRRFTAERLARRVSPRARPPAPTATAPGLWPPRRLRSARLPRRARW